MCYFHSQIKDNMATYPQNIRVMIWEFFLSGRRHCDSIFYSWLCDSIFFSQFWYVLLREIQNFVFAYFKLLFPIQFSYCSWRPSQARRRLTTGTSSVVFIFLISKKQSTKWDNHIHKSKTRKLRMQNEMSSMIKHSVFFQLEAGGSRRKSGLVKLDFRQDSIHTLFRFLIPIFLFPTKHKWRHNIHQDIFHQHRQLSPKPNVQQMNPRHHHHRQDRCKMCLEMLWEIFRSGDHWYPVEQE